MVLWLFSSHKRLLQHQRQTDLCRFSRFIVTSWSGYNQWNVAAAPVTCPLTSYT